MSKRITFEIDAKGNGKIVDVEGFGKGCINATAGLEAKLGTSNEGSRDMTDNFHVAADQDVQVDNSS